MPSSIVNIMQLAHFSGIFEKTPSYFHQPSCFQELRDAKPEDPVIDATGGGLGLAIRDDCDLEDPPGDPPSQRYLSLPAPKYHNGSTAANGIKLSNGHVNYLQHNDSGVESQV